ncbi:MAG: hypothetical protein KZQ99_09985 [Candidatus Thiodiazotropha sp. (ex Dulcina madagascariensis)]|nr:hypothetical protein [Candidatus Thiodiazotropha sp. (ex Dulcina madagascariensis)]
MNSLKMSPFYRKISTVETMISDVSAQYPDMQPALDDLIYPILFLTRLANEAGGVLANDPNSIERMRYLLVPVATEEAYIRDAVSELLPSRSDYDDEAFERLKSKIDLNDTFIHYGELVVLALAAGRVGMQPFNLTNSTKTFIDVIKFYALATLPVQALLRALYTGLDINNFILSIGRQSKTQPNYMLLKSLARTFWDSRELASAIAIDELMQEVENYFKTRDFTGWDGGKGIAIKNIALKVSNASHRIHIDSDFDPAQHGDSLKAFFVWERVIDGDKSGYATQPEALTGTDYKLTGNTLKINDYDHPSGWLGLQTEADLEMSQKFRARMNEHWKKINAKHPVLTAWPVPLEKLPGNTEDSRIIPIIKREKSNKWGPGIIEKNIIFPDQSEMADGSDALAKLEIKFVSATKPRFKLESHRETGSVEIPIETVSMDEPYATFAFALDPLTEADRNLYLSLYAGKRNAAYDIEPIDLSHWLADVTEGDAEDETLDATSPTGSVDTVEVSVTDTPSIDTPIVVVRPGLLHTTAGDSAPADNAAKVMQVSSDTATAVIDALGRHANLSFNPVRLPFMADEEVTFLSEEDTLSDNAAQAVLDRLAAMAERTSGMPGAIWVSLVESSPSFYKVGLSTNSNGLIAATPDRLNQAYDQLRLLAPSANNATPEDAVNLGITALNGALSTDKFIHREQRILQNNMATIPSQWVAIGYSKNRQLLFERRINFPSETFSGDITLSLPDLADLDKIELRYMPQLFAIEVTSITQPKLAEASVRLLSNASALKGSAFRPVTPTPKIRLITLQKIAGEVDVKAEYNPTTHHISWSKGHSAGLDTQVRIHIRNSAVSRVFTQPTGNTNRLNLDNMLFKHSEATDIQAFELSVSDGWNSKSDRLETSDHQLALDSRALLPRTAGDSLFWADIDDAPGSDARVNWYVNDKQQFADSVPADTAVRLSGAGQTASVRVEYVEGTP